MSLVFGVGKTNSKTPLTKWGYNEKGEHKRIWICPIYSAWLHMLERCYSKKERIRAPSYEGCYVSEDWLTFSNFRDWAETQDYAGKQLDKDLLVYQNKCYSKDTCIFLPIELNSCLVTKRIRDLPLGVKYVKKSKGMLNERKKPYTSEIKTFHKRNYLPYRSTAEEAHRDWQLAKVKWALGVASMQTDERIIAGFHRIANKIQKDYDNYVLTVDF